MALKDTLKKLIEFRTVTGRNEEIKKAYAWVRHELKGLPVYFKEYEFNGVPNLVITTKKDQKNPKVWLAAHMDVVDGTEAAWQIRESDGRLYGRGTHDMKFAIACFVELCKSLGQSLSRHDIGIMLTGDEEIAGYNGTRALVEEAGYRGGVVFLPDGGGVWKFEEAAKGYCKLAVTASGQPAHASRPWQGKSAIHTLLRFLLEIETICGEYWQTDEEHWHLTHTIAMINGGLTRNQVAGDAEAVIDIRFTTLEEYADFKAKLDAVAAAHSRISVLEEQYTEPHSVSREHEAAAIFASVAAKSGIECGWSYAHGASDARHFSAHDIPVLLIWPNASGLHSDEEWIDLADLERYYRVLKEWIQVMAKDGAGKVTPGEISGEPESEIVA